MNNLFVPYDIALSLKEMGFDEPCLTSYWTANAPSEIQHSMNYKEGDLETVDRGNLLQHLEDYNSNKGGEFVEDICSAPLYDQVIQWLEDKHQLLLYCTKIKGDWLWKIDSATGGYLELCYDTFTNRKDGLNAGIKKAIELIKQK